MPPIQNQVPPLHHKLKTWPIFYNACVSGAKTFDIRRNDRDYQIGDLLKFVEFDPVNKRETGNTAWFKVVYLISGAEHKHIGIHPDFVVMGIEPIKV